jgi:type II secretory pathway pseudopilin PulG
MNEQMQEPVQEIVQEVVQEVNTVEPVIHDDGGAQMGAETQVATENMGEMPEPNRQEYNWRQANESLSRMKEEKNQMQQQLNVLNNFVHQQQMAQQSQQQPQQDQGFFKGREKDDLSSVGDVEGYVDNRVNTAVGQKTKEFELIIDELQVKAKDPNFKQKIETYQQFLTPAQKQAIMQSNNPWSDAYSAVVNSAAYYKDQISQQQSPSAKRISDNMQKPGSVSSVGSSASLRSAEKWENYSDAELIRLGDRYANGGS